MPTLTAERTAAFMPAAGAPTFSTATLKLLWKHVKCEVDSFIFARNRVYFRFCYSRSAEWINKRILVCTRLHAAPTVVIIADAAGAKPWGELDSMESATLPPHLTDPQWELPPLEPQQPAKAAPDRVEQVIPQRGGRGPGVIWYHWGNLGPMKRPVTTVIVFTANTLWISPD